MDSFRIGEKNKIINRMKEINTFIERNTETIKRFKGQSKVSAFELKQIEKLDKKNNEYEEDLNKLKEDILSIEKGNFDVKYKDNKIKAFENIKKMNDKIINKRIDREEKEVEKKQFVQKSFDINRKVSSYHIDKEEERFHKISSSIAPYILRNLKEMPNNKGYIFKGIWCFGELPRENNANVIMFEKCYNDIMKIHEIDDKFYCIYEKIGKNRKTLISKIERSAEIKKCINNV
jgi:hypothetical protein